MAGTLKVYHATSTGPGGANLQHLQENGVLLPAPWRSAYSQQTEGLYVDASRENQKAVAIETADEDKGGVPLLLTFDCPLSCLEPDYESPSLPLATLHGFKTELEDITAESDVALPDGRLVTRIRSVHDAEHNGLDITLRSKGKKLPGLKYTEETVHMPWFRDMDEGGKTVSQAALLETLRDHLAATYQEQWKAHEKSCIMQAVGFDEAQDDPSGVRLKIRNANLPPIAKAEVYRGGAWESIAPPGPTPPSAPDGPAP